MELNKVHNIDFLNNDLPDKCAKLIIADPPYYKVKGDFDFIWKTFDDYLKDVEKWAIECKRILADNGTLLWYGDAKNIAYAQIIFDKHFNLLNSIVWENTNDHKQQIRFNEDLRTFAPLTERILMYSTDFDVDFNVDIRSDKNNFLPIKQYMRDERKKCGLSASKLKEKTGLLCNLKLIGMYFGDVQWQLPTKENYEMMQTTGYWQKPFEVLRKEFEVLREKFELQRRPFNNALHLGDVIRLPNYETSDYDHDTIKPEKLTRILITTCSRENDLVVVPFAGSGTECAMSAKEKRNFIGYEITEKHAKMSQKRADKILSEPTMF
jgi:DNA modification methylase